MSFDPHAVLKKCGGQADAEIDLFLAAMAFAAAARPELHTDRYFQHVSKLVRDCRARHEALISAGAADDARTRLAALKHILCDQEAYIGDAENYDDLQNADMTRVIDRRKGMPIALSILYIHTGRALGWTLEGLNFPGHFLCRTDHRHERLIFDPFSACRVMEAPDLRALVKEVRGKNAELSADYYRPCTNREMLVRLQNNVKLRLITAEDYEGALKIVEMMRLLDPGEERLLFDAGVLYAKLGRRGEAVTALKAYLFAVKNPMQRKDAERILYELGE
jgi:regulator of sirC expression with transglutaminase-like and TPR domain